MHHPHPRRIEAQQSHRVRRGPLRHRDNPFSAAGTVAGGGVVRARGGRVRLWIQQKCEIVQCHDASPRPPRRRDVIEAVQQARRRPLGQQLDG